MLAPVVLAADYTGTVDVADLTEARARITKLGAVAGAPPQPAVLGLDLVADPQLHVRIADRRWEYNLGYTPWLTLQDVEPSPPPGVTRPQILNVGGASAAWHDRLVRIAVTEDVTYGSFNSGFLVPSAPEKVPAGTITPPPSVQAVPQPQTITMLSSRTATTLSARPARRVTFSLGAAWLIAGGLDASSQAVLPQQQGPRLDSSFSYALSRRDQAVTFAYAQYSEFTRFNCSALVGLLPGAGLCAPQDEILQASQGIRHALERSTTLTVSAGGTFANERTHRDQPYHTAGFPNADLSLTHSFGERGSIVLELDAQLAPWVDFHTGLVSNRVQGQASLSDAVNKVVTLRVTATGLQTVPTTDTYALEMVSGSASMELRVDRQVLLAFGERGVWETQDALGTFLSTVTYLDVTVRAPTLPF